MFTKIGAVSFNVKKDEISIPIFRKIGENFQCEKGQGQSSNIYKNRGRIPM